MQVWSLGWKDPLKEGMVTHSNILAQRIPWTEEPGGLQSIGSKSRTWLKWLSLEMKLKLISLFIFYFLNVTMRKLKIISVAYILVCSILLWDSPSQPNETSACCNPFLEQKIKWIKNFPSSPRPLPLWSWTHWLNPVQVLGTGTFDRQVFTILRPFSGCSQSAGPNCEPFRSSDLSLLSLPSASHFILSLDDSVHVHGFIYHLQTDDIQICIFCPNSSPDITNLAAGWMTAVSCPAGPSKHSMSSVGLWLFVPCLFLSHFVFKS